MGVCAEQTGTHPCRSLPLKEERAWGYLVGSGGHGNLSFTHGGQSPLQEVVGFVRWEG